MKNLFLFFSFLMCGAMSFSASAEQLTIKAPGISFHRDLELVEGRVLYTVNGRAPHLYMISRDLYGNEKYWSEIAKWNNVAAPYNLEPGQRLVIRKAPTSTTQQGDADLIKSWTELKKWSVVEGIKLSQQAEEAEAPKAVVAEVQEPIVEEPKEVVPEEPAHAELKAELEGKPEPAALVVVAPVVIAETAAAPAPVHAEPVHHSRWHFGVGLAASGFELESKNHASNVNNFLSTEVDYGVDLEAAYRISDQSHLIFTAMVEHMDITHSEDVEVEGHSQYIWKFGAGLETAVTPTFSLAGSLIYEQLPFVKPTATGAVVDAIYIPQLSFGGRSNFIAKGNFKAFFVFDLLMLMPKFQDEQDIKTGEGFVLGLKMQNKLQRSTLSYGVSYRYIQQNTSESDNNQKAVFANLGLLF